MRSDQAILDKLENKAVHYLARYASTARRLETVLTRFGRRKLPDEDKKRMAALIARKVEECRERGYVDDEEFAKTRSARLRKQGVSLAGIRRKLAERGVEKDVIDRILDTMDDSDAAKMKAAAIHARRRRLGPYARREKLREGWQNRHLGSFARAGFSYDVARRILEFEDAESFEAWLSENDDD